MKKLEIMYSYQNSRQKGFILVTTLWILAILTMVAGFFSLWTQKTVEIAQTMQADMQGEIDMYNTQSTIIYLLVTQRFTIAGLTVPQTPKQMNKTREVIEYDSVAPRGGEIAVDDRAYFGIGKAYFALQDKRGLIGINFAAQNILYRLLSLLGVKTELQAPLIAKLEDYVDIDDLHRLNGAEAYHYEKRGLPPPPNRFLMTPMECQNILDWAEQSGLWKNNQFGQLTNVILAGYPNFNTAPSLVLQAAYNMNATSAERIIQRRKTKPFSSLSIINYVAGIHLNLDSFDLNFFPSSSLRLTLWYEGARRMRQIHLHLPLNVEDKKPWRIDYTLELELLPTYSQSSPLHAQTSFFSPTLSTIPQ